MYKAVTSGCGKNEAWIAVTTRSYASLTLRYVTYDRHGSVYIDYMRKAIVKSSK